MTETFQELLGYSEAQLKIGFFVFLRIGAAMALLPVVGERSVPGRVRLALALAFTIVILPAATQFFPPGLAGNIYMVNMGYIEIVIGLLIGISLRLFVFSLQIAGAIAAQSTSLSQLFGAAGVDPQPALGHVLVIGGLALAVTLGLHVHIAELLIYSYEFFPPGHLVPGIDLASWGSAHFSRVFGLSFSLAAPFLIASLIYNIALGAINRAMPQLMVSFVGAPAITAGGLILFFVTAPLMLSAWYKVLSAYLENPFGL